MVWVLFAVALFLISHLVAWHMPENRWQWLLRLFYRRVHLVGDLPEEPMATLVVANHPNAFIDPFALQAATGRKMVRTIRADWLRHWWVKHLVKLVGAIPLARAQTGQNHNHNSFKQLHQHLTDGEWVVVFPEGVSHNRGRLRTFKKGAAHLAKQYVAATGKPIRVVQLALYYDDKSRLESDVWVKVVETQEYSDEAEFADLSAVCQQWQDTIETALPGPLRSREVVVYNWLNACLRAFSQQPLVSSQQVAHWLYNSRLTHLQSWLKVTGLELDVLAHHRTARDLIKRLASELVILALGLPLAMIGMLLNGPLALLHFGLTHYHSKAADKWASNAFVIGLPLYPILWLASAFIHPLLPVIAAVSGLYALAYWKTLPQRHSTIATCVKCLSHPYTRDQVLSVAKDTLDALHPTSSRMT